MSATLDPIPEYDPLLDDAGHLGDRWYRWLSSVIARLLTATLLINAIHRTSLGGAIATTTIFTPSQPGDYRVSWYLRITTAASVSSSATVTIRWKDGGIAQSKTFAAITGNTTGTTDSGTCLLRPDSGQPISYEVAYASVGAPAMVYALDVTVEEVS